MYQRQDGIVEFDPDVCIGCKACIQACPYDAIHIDPDTGTAAKCHFCSHRTDIGLEPACVVVCPEHAIIAGDMDDPQSEITRYLAHESVTVRKPEQGTVPKLFYVDGHAPSMQPTAVIQDPAHFMYTDKLDPHTPVPFIAAKTKKSSSKSKSGTPIFTPAKQGMPATGPLQVGGRHAEQMIQVGFNGQHKLWWHWQVPAYIVTKDIATGIFALLGILTLTGVFEPSALFNLISSAVINFFLVVTTLLLVFDLERPERFFSIVLRPQWRSWLTRGAFLLIGFSGLAAVLLLWDALMLWAPERGPANAAGLRQLLLLAGFPLALLTSVYTAWLFAQAEGRDLWQNPVLSIQFLVRTFVSGFAALILISTFSGIYQPLLPTLAGGLTISVAIDFLLVWFCEVRSVHVTDTAAMGAKIMTSGPYRKHFWIGGIAVGHAVAALAIMVNGPILGVCALAALVGLFYREYAFVMSAQLVPNS